MQLSSMASSVSVMAYTQPSTECSGLNSTLGNPPASSDVPIKVKYTDWSFPHVTFHMRLVAKNRIRPLMAND